jgi:hypothetical protein
MSLSLQSMTFPGRRQQVSSDVDAARTRIQRRRETFDRATGEVNELLVETSDLMSEYEVLNASQPATSYNEWVEWRRR